MKSFPTLLKRVVKEYCPEVVIEIIRPWKLLRGKLHTEAFEKLVKTLYERERPDLLVVLMDADDDCPAQLGAKVLSRAKAVIPQPVSVVLANREYEAWFLAARPSLAGHALEEGFEPERRRNAKQQVQNLILNGQPYSEVIDQPKLTQKMSLTEAASCRSFRKLCSDLLRLIAGISHPSSPTH